MSILAAALILPACGASKNRHASTYAGPPLAKEELVRLSAAGLSETVMLEVLESRGAVPLKADDVAAIKLAGAADAVIARMIALERKEPEVVVLENDYTYRPSPVHFGVGVGMGHYGGWYGPRVGFGVGFQFVR